MKKMGKILFYLSAIIWLSLCACTSYSANYTGKKLFKISVTDSTLNNIIQDYIREYSFEGKGVYLVNVKKVNDTTKFYVGVVFTSENIDLVLKNRPYYFYETVSNRIVIIDTKVEEFIEPEFSSFDKETILSKFLEPKGSTKWRDVYFLEFKKAGNSISKKVIDFDPY